MENIHTYKYRVGKEEKNKKLGHKSPVIWLTGLSGSGKSTLANALDQRLFDRNIKTYVLDGDNIRTGLSNDLGFSNEDRKENMRRISEVANLFSDSGTLVITAFISPFKEGREKAKELIGEDNFFEVHVDCNLETCESRDPKGLYKKARAGEIKKFTGIDSPYEKPSNPDVVVETNLYNVDECVDKIIFWLEKKGFIPSSNKEVDNLDKRKTISIDFDGVIHKYSKGFQGVDNAYDPPMEGAIDALKKLKSDGYILKILSSRPKEVIYPWLDKYGISDLITEVSNHKFPATVYIDDRGFHFEDWKTTLKELPKHPKLKK